jgi:hypothetical protein
MTKDEEKDCKLEELKENYKKIEKEYNLPSFNELNKEFSIEKVSEIETDFLIREIGRVMAEKLSNYLRFVEMILNPVNAPMFIFSLVKSLGEDERRILSNIYKDLTKIELNLIELDVSFSEKKEADFINNSYKTWMNIKKDLLIIIEKIKSSLDNRYENSNKGYFG